MLSVLALPLYLLAAVLGVVGYVLFLVAAWREGLLWAIFCFFFWPVQLLFLLTHWRQARGAFFLQVVAAVLGLLAALLQGRLHGS